jgi:hypothetical protein
MIDYVTWHAVLGSIFALSSLGLLIVTWQLLGYFVLGIEDRAASLSGPLQGAMIVALCRPRVSVMVAYRFSYAAQKCHDWQARERLWQDM